MAKAWLASLVLSILIGGVFPSTPPVPGAERRGDAAGAPPFAARERGERLEREGRFSEALNALAPAEALARVRAPNDRLAYLRVIGTKTRLLFRLGRNGEAEESARQGLAASKQAYGDDHPAVAATLEMLGQVLVAEGKFADALAGHRRALDIHEKADGPDRPSTWTALLGTAWANLNLHQFVDAEAAYRRLIAMAEKDFGPNHRSTADVRVGLGKALMFQLRLFEARAELERAVSIQEQLPLPDRLDAMEALLKLGRIASVRGDQDEAVAYGRRALALSQKAARGGDDLNVAVGLHGLAEILELQRRHAEALPLLQRAIEIRERLLRKDALATGLALSELGRVMLGLKQYEASKESLRRAFAILQRDPTADAWTVTRTRLDFALARLRSGKALEAYAAFADEAGFTRASDPASQRPAAESIEDAAYTGLIEAAFAAGQSDLEHAGDFMDAAFRAAQDCRAALPAARSPISRRASRRSEPPHSPN